MMKAKSGGRNLFLILTCGFCFFLFSCGLESIVYLDPPFDAQTPSRESTDPVKHFFSFKTANSKNSSADGIDGFSYLGTAVYYKIYGSYDTLASEKSKIETANSSSTTNTAASSLINTYNFKPLKLQGPTPEVLVPKDTSYKFVYIRLNDVLGSSEINSEYQRDVRVDSDKIENSTQGTRLGLPMRNIPQKNGFDFGATGSGSFGCVESDLPVESDEDVAGSASESGIWYVAAYAFSVGRDGSFNPSYSKVLPLGAIKINAADYINK